MEKIERFQGKALYVSGIISLAVLSIFYIVTVFLVTKDRWTFGGDVTYDVLFLSFMTVGYFLAISLFVTALKFSFPWMHYAVLILCICYIAFISSRIGVMQGEDNRWEIFRSNFFYQPGKNK